MVLVLYVTILTNFSVYQLTNIYSRGALTEFIAYQLILLGVSLIYYSILYKNKISNSILALGFLSLIFALGAHPVTFYTFTIFVLPIIFIYTFFNRSKFVNFSKLNIFLMMLIGVIILLPWFFSVLQYKNEFRISTTDHFARKIYYFPDTIDSLLAKFGFFYIDKRVNEDGLFSTPTPFLNAPLPLISIALSFFFFYCALTSEKLKLLKYLCPALFIIMILIIGIIPPDAGQVGLWTGTAYVSGDFSLIHRILSPIQFAYRLSGTISLCFVVMTIFSVHLFANTNPSDNFVNKLNKYI